MKQEIAQGQNLLRLEISLFELDDIQIEDLGEKLYKDLFLDTEFSGVQYTHDNQPVSFSKDRFRHAFYLSPNKNEIDKRRVARIKWILPLIEGKVLNSECWLINDGGIKKRLYVCFGLNYLVWLEPQGNKDRWIFSTAYVAERKQIRGYTSRGTRISEFFGKKKKGS